ncbi:MAG: WbqC family protein, partial [Muribaculaceae bacterium]|nr:WbqC family protein [Muribaculaceae bacterium]
VRAILGFDAPIVDMSCVENYECVDFRRADFAQFTPRRSYWQVRADRFGFIPGLSVLDLIFNLGPEAPLFFFSE